MITWGEDMTAMVEGRKVIFDQEKALRATQFFELLKHVDGEFYGQPFKMLPWQQKIVSDIYGTVFDDDGSRVYRFCYIEIPKKNGKTELGAGFALYQLFMDGEMNGEVYSCAADRKQASIVYKVAKKMIELIPEMDARSKVTDSVKLITDEWTGSAYEVLSAESFTKHGFKPSGVIFDELHAQPNRDLWDVMTFGSGAARRQTLWVILTTAGDDPERVSIGWEVHEYAAKVLAGEIHDPTWYVTIFNYEGDDIYNENHWHEANPSLGVAKSLKSMRAEAITAKNMKANERLFRWLHLNQWVTDKLSSWLPIELWDQTTEEIREEELAGKICFVGQDASTTTDLSALAVIFPPQAGLPKWHVKFEAFLPGETLRDRVKGDRVPYDAWAKQGWLTATDGTTIDHWAIDEKVQEIQKKYQIAELVSDPAFAVMLTQQEMKHDVKVVTMQGTFVNQTDPINLIETLLRSGQMTHQPNDLVRWCFGNSSIAMNGSGLKKLVKETRGKGLIRTKRIDPIMAWVLGMSRARFYESQEEDINEIVMSDDWGM